MESIARNLVPIEIEQEMSASYLDYSMSVIVGRALPDVRDGLKPVHRRILYAMWRENLLSNRPYRKCANVVGEVLGKFHPHGDASVYDALVRMAQPWNMRYLLVDGQGNFGSVDGDNAAAYRYTECRMTRLSEQLLLDIEKETVNFSPNYDQKQEEPDVLPAAYPNLLVNGAEGIAVGMATKIPPHNLGEIIDGLMALIANPDIDVAGLMQYIPAPDFPTAGKIYGIEGVRDAYTTGRGRILIRGNAVFEEIDGREAIIINELPFQVNKARFQEEIDGLAKAKKLEGIHAVRDESNRDGMRVVVELKRDAVREVVLNNLFKHTQLQVTFGVIMLAIVNQRPQVLTLKEVLQCYLGHRREVTLRRTRFELRKAKERAHILEGYRIALDHIDEVIATIRAAASTDDARTALVARFSFSLIQADKILEMQLRRLTGLERDKIEEEYREVKKQIAGLLEILGSDTRLLEVIQEELLKVRQQYADVRRTEIVNQTGALSLHDLVAEEDQVVTRSHRGYIKRTPLTDYRMQKRGGQGRTGMSTREEDFVQHIFIANTHASLLVFTNQGRMYVLRVVDVPEAGPAARGKPIVNLVNLLPGETVAGVVSVRNFEEAVDLIFASRRGLVKRTELIAYQNARTNGIYAVDIADGDELLTVMKAPRDADLMLSSRQGMAIRFDGEDIRPMGRVARGVKGIELDEGDEVVSLAMLPADTTNVQLLTATTMGYGKRTELSEYRNQTRGGKGLIDIQTGERSGGESNGEIVGAVVVWEEDQVLVITDTGRIIRMRASDVRSTNRNTLGVRLMRLEDGERIVGIARLEDDAEKEEEKSEATVANEENTESAENGEAAVGNDEADLEEDGEAGEE